MRSAPSTNQNFRSKTTALKRHDLRAAYIRCTMPIWRKASERHNPAPRGDGHPALTSSIEIVRLCGSSAIGPAVTMRVGMSSPPSSHRKSTRCVRLGSTRRIWKPSVVSFAICRCSFGRMCLIFRWGNGRSTPAIAVRSWMCPWGFRCFTGCGRLDPGLLPTPFMQWRWLVGFSGGLTQVDFFHRYCYAGRIENDWP